MEAPLLLYILAKNQWNVSIPIATIFSERSTQNIQFKIQTLSDAMVRKNPIAVSANGEIMRASYIFPIRSEE